MDKIAITTQDGEKISNHFGMAPYYRVFDIEANKVMHDTLREKPHKQSHEHSTNHEHGHHGLGTRALETINDCQVLICGGMGQPAFQKAESAGLEIYLIGGSVEDAIHAYQKGELISDQRRIHSH